MYSVVTTKKMTLNHVTCHCTTIYLLCMYSMFVTVINYFKQYCNVFLIGFALILQLLSLVTCKHPKDPSGFLQRLLKDITI